MSAPSRSAAARPRRLGRPGALRLALVLAALMALGALLPAAAVEAKPRFGLHVNSEQQTTQEEWNRMGAGNVGIVRRSFPYTTDEVRFDGRMRETSAAGLSVLPVVIGSPDGDLVPPTSRDDRGAYKAFLRNLVERYGPDGSFWAENPGLPYRPITAWQIWNEPSIDYFWGADPDAREYAKLLEAARAAIDSRDPGGEAILAGMPYDHARGVPFFRYLKELYDVRRIEEQFDAVALHPYGRDEDEVRFFLERLRSRLKSLGDGGRDVWITEMGWANDGPEEHPFVKSTWQQARLLRKSFELFEQERKRYNLRTVVWYNWQDFPAENGPFHLYTGLFEYGGDPKPAWQEFTSFTGGIAGAGSLATGDSKAASTGDVEDPLDAPAGDDVLPPPANGSSGQ